MTEQDDAPLEDRENRREEEGGLRFFPLHGITSNGACTCNIGAKCKDIGKHPMVRWRTYDENEKGPSQGFGIPTGSRNGIFVIDLDVRPAQGDKPAKNGVAEILRLAAGRPLPKTLWVRTPTGGVHLYFKLPKLPPGPRIANKRALALGVDVRGEGGYVVGPGSPHKNGGTYGEGQGELADAPDWLLELVIEKTPEKEDLASPHRTIDPTSPEGVRAIEWVKGTLSETPPAIEGQGGSDVFFAVACKLMYSALPLETLRDLVEEVYNPRCAPPWSTKEIEHKLEDADDRMEEPRGLPSADFFLKLQGRTSDTSARITDPAHEYTFEPGMRSGGETRRASFGEITGDLFDHADWAGVWAYDSFRDIVVAVNPPMKLEAETEGLQDNDVQLVRAWLEYHGKKLQTPDVWAAIELVARRRAFDPRRDYLQAVAPLWDGQPRLDRVLPVYFETADGKYERGIGPRWIISLVARAMSPGCQSDCTLILEGPQGIGKTSAFRALMPRPEWYANTSSGVEHKDFKQNLLGIWLMGFDELDSLAKASLTKVKTELTETRDHYRKSFGRAAKGFPRTVGFCGSTNAEMYFNDPTGSRRYWPAKVLRTIKVHRIAEDRDQIWAEAYVRWQAGEAWHVNTPDLLRLCEEEQEARLAIDTWEEELAAWLQDTARVTFLPTTTAPSSGFRGGMQPYDASLGITTSAALEKGIGKLKGQWTTGDSQRVGNILRRLGFIRKQTRVGHIRQWRYFLP